MKLRAWEENVKSAGKFVTPGHGLSHTQLLSRIMSFPIQCPNSHGPRPAFLRQTTSGIADYSTGRQDAVSPL